MPYESDAQRRKFHAMLNRGEISAATVHEFDQASKGKDLPERVKRKGKVRKAAAGALVQDPLTTLDSDEVPTTPARPNRDRGLGGYPQTPPASILPPGTGPSPAIPVPGAGAPSGGGTLVPPPAGGGRGLYSVNMDFQSSAPVTGAIGSKLTPQAAGIRRGSTGPGGRVPGRRVNTAVGAKHGAVVSSAGLIADGLAAADFPMQAHRRSK